MNILEHYLRMACQKAGVHWDNENERELYTIVDEVRAAARAEVGEELADLEARLTRLETLLEVSQ